MERSYVHRGGEKPLLGYTIEEVLRDVGQRHGDRDAVVSIPQDIRLSYSELWVGVDALARGLLAIGVGRGTRVGIWAVDNHEWVLVQLATASVGAILVNINPAYRRTELQHALSIARVEVLFLMPSFRGSHYLEMVAEQWPDGGALPELREVVVFEPDQRHGDIEVGSGMKVWDEVVALGRTVDANLLARAAAELDPDDPINIQFTSGTTGFPKPVVLTHHNILNNGYFCGDVMRFTAADRLCVPVPFYHCFGMIVANLAALTHGAALVIPAPHFEAGAVLHAVEAERCTALHGVPTMFIAELERPDFGKFDLSSLRTGIMAGAPCPPELVRRVMEEMGCREILIGYGQTEASPVTHCTRPSDSFERRLGTVGTNLPHQEVKIVDTATGAILPIGRQGEVCFRGYHVMHGYFENEEATKKTIDERGWLHSGDLGVLDEDGYLQITGRLKDMIIRGGENIYPAEIEALYFDHPKVAEVAVFGVADDHMGEEVAAWVRLHDGMHAEVDELRSFAAENLAHFKVPRYLEVVDDFPMTVTGKIQKFRMREILEQRLAASGS